jgi:hypothetical protein
VVEKLKVTIILAWFLYPDSQNVVYQKEIDNIEAGCTTNFPLDAFALLYFAFSLSFFKERDVRRTG